MIEKFYKSNLTGEIFTTEEEAIAAEGAVAKAEEEKKAKESKRAERAKEVEKAFTDAAVAEKRAQNLLKEFCKDYGSFHTSLKEPFDFTFGNFFWNLI